ncbi:MAG: hypothetical protein JXB05_15075 [Myxococcaceae bacterium]|nr:hypothetical protein [Myxococcaceae bacterium]
MPRCLLIPGLLHSKVPSVFEQTPESLTDVDFQFWHENYMRSRQSLLDSSLTQLYRAAERHRS